MILSDVLRDMPNKQTVAATRPSLNVALTVHSRRNVNMIGLWKVLTTSRNVLSARSVMLLNV